MHTCALHALTTGCFAEAFREWVCARGELFEAPEAVLLLLHKRRVLAALGARKYHRMTLAALELETGFLGFPVSAKLFVRVFMARETVVHAGVIELRPVRLSGPWARATGAPWFKGACPSGAACPRGTTCRYSHAPTRVSL